MPAATRPHNGRRRGGIHGDGPGGRAPGRPEPLVVRVGGQTALALQAGNRAVRVSLVVPVIDRLIDVSAHPAAALTALRDAAARTGTPVEAAEATLRHCLVATAAPAGAWQADATVPLLDALGGAALPMIGAACRAGAAALPEVPRWAVPILAETTPRAAARRALGTAATRPVTAALARGLVRSGPGPVDLVPLALALMGADVLEPDQLARVLAAPPPDPPPGAQVPERSVIELGRSLAPRWGARRLERVLLGAASAPGGVGLLERTLRYARDLGDHAPMRLPNELQALHDLYRSLTATDPGPRPRPVPTARPRRNAPATAPGRDGPTRRDRGLDAAPADGPDLVAAPRPPRRVDPQAQARARIYAPTPGHPAVDARTPLTVPADVLALDGRSLGSATGLTLVVPRTVGDLERWSRLLRNCLGSYGPAAAAGASTIIGVRRAGDLRHALELTGLGVIRQFVSVANRPVEPLDRRTVVAALVDAGVMDPRHPGNGPWVGD